MVRKPWTRTRKGRQEAAAGGVFGAVAAGAIAACVVSYLPHTPSYPFIPAYDDIGIPSGSYAPGTDSTPGENVKSVPVLSWHQMDNGCAPTAARCSNPEYAGSSVTQRQFYDQLSWLYSHGYRTITIRQYTAWATGRNIVLPAKPVLLTVDDGIANFYAGATPVLQHFGYTMTAMIVSGFAQGAQDGTRQYKGWDATWTQLRNLPSPTWNFAFHAGPEGHLVNTSSCAYFYPCQRAGETASAYQARVTTDISLGTTAEKTELGPRVDTSVWAVPFNDLAGPGQKPKAGRAPESWLGGFANARFAVVFVDGKVQSENQHYRYEVHGTDSLSFFASQVQRTDIYTTYPESVRPTATARAGGQS